MAPKSVSVIIPCRNEENYLKIAIDSIKRQNYPSFEIIAVVNDSGDKTIEVAKNYCDKFLEFPDRIGVSAARNRGAEIANGEILIFLDADTILSENAIEKIAHSMDKNTIGTCLTNPSGNNFIGKSLFKFRNFVHFFKIYKGVGGVFFCHKDIFSNINGFNEEKMVAEFSDFILRATKNGADYKYVKDCYAETSLRRFEKRGYLGIFWFWLKWRIGLFFKNNREAAEKYFEN
jgi:glycosyltransferase involved in cell wall biosynthesis